MSSSKYPSHWTSISAVFAFVALVISFLFYLLYLDRIGEREAEARAQQEAALHQAEIIFDARLESARRDTFYLADSQVVRTFADTRSVEAQAQVERYLSEFLRSRLGLYDQVRLIDARGFEVARVNQFGSTVRIAPKDQLQDKSDRYYFREVIGLSPYALYLSSLDLNIEQGAIEEPAKPVLRIATPIVDSEGVVQGSLVINLLAGRLIDEMTKEAQERSMSLYWADARGRWLIAPDSQSDWSAEDGGLAQSYPLLWHGLTRSAGLSEFRFSEQERAAALILRPDFQPETGMPSNRNLLQEELWYLITEYPVGQLALWKSQVKDALMPVYTALLLLALGLSYWAGQQLARRQRALAQVIQREHMFERLLQAAPDATLVSDTEGTIRSVNSAAERLFGYSESELVGLSIDQLVPMEHRSGHAKLRQSYMKSPVPRALRSGSYLSAVTKQGDVIPVTIALNAIDSGDEVLVVGAVRDVREEYEQRRSTELLSERLKMATAAGDIGIWEYEVASGLLRIDQRMANYFGCLREDLVLNMKELSEFFVPEERDALQRAFRRAMVDQTPIDLRLRTDEQPNRWVHLRGSPQTASSGVVKLLVGTHTDVTEEVDREYVLRSAYEQSTQANIELEAANVEIGHARDAAQLLARSKAEFLANMSHEIRTPLNAVLGINQLLKAKIDQPDAQALILKQAESARTLLGVVDDVLDYSRIESGHIEIEERCFSLLELFENLSTLISTALSEKRLRCVFSIPDRSCWWLKGDSRRLEQILINLCTNAIKFSDQGVIAVSAQVIDSGSSTTRMRFSVSDQGIGIEPEQLPHLFDPFKQADASISRRFGGSGLGLAICKRLVELMDGRFEVDSVSGEGSVFSFEISMERTEEPEDQRLSDLAPIQLLYAGESGGLMDGYVSTARALGARVQAGSVEQLVQRTFELSAEEAANTVLIVAPEAKSEQALLKELEPLFDLPDPRRPNLAFLIPPDAALDAYEQLVPVNTVLQEPMGPLMFHYTLSHLTSHAQESASQPVDSVVELKRLMGCRILLVDDNSINLEIAEMMLRGQGALVWTATNGQEALAWLTAKPRRLDLILMDVQMPVLDGLEATRTIRTLPDYAQIPILALSAGVIQRQREEAIDAGMNGFIAKPLDLERAVRLIRSEVKKLDPDAFDTADPNELETGPQPRLDGKLLDTEYGLRIFRQPENYHRYLRSFLDMHGQFPLQLPQLSEDPAGAQSLIHKLRGSARYLGLDRLAADCNRYELILEEQGEMPDYSALIATFFETRDAIESFLSEA